MAMCCKKFSRYLFINIYFCVKFKTLKKELVRKHIFLTREIAASKIFEYIEMFYNSKKRHSYLGYISPNEFEKRYNYEAPKN